MDCAGRRLYLCAGTQSSGSTLVSWCFLQRPDMDGILDADNDYLPKLPPGLGRPLAWYKTTISSFRLTELAAGFRDQGWDVRPMLIARDVRAVWASIVRKSYVRNGITAEDPPIRLRLRRFKEDWQACVRHGWPVLSYERFLEQPESTLRAACAQLGLCWSQDMIAWPKSPRQIADSRHGNQTFRSSRGTSLAQTILPADASSRRAAIQADDLQWLEEEFREFNAALGYEASWGGAARSAALPPAPEPRFEVTRRHRWELRRKPLRWLMWNLGWRGPWLPAERRMAAVAARTNCDTQEEDSAASANSRAA